MKKGDFIKIEYSAYDENNMLFDSTKGEVAKSLHGKEGPLLIVFGFDRIVAGLEQELQKMKKGDKSEIHLLPEHAFGQRDKSLIRIMSIADFTRNEVRPVPGLTVNVDTDYGKQFGIIKSVSGGRVLVDFNHPLAGKKVRYTVELMDLITDPVGKVESIMKDANISGNVKLENDHMEIRIKEEKNFNEVKKYLESVVFKVVKEVKKIEVVKVN